MKKGYHEYEPMKGNKPEKPEFVSKGRISEYNKERRAKKLKEQKEAKKSKFVTKDTFELQFGFEYPKVYQRQSYVETIKYPKTQGSNGKVSRFR